jgi:hypothetical protein
MSKTQGHFCWYELVTNDVNGAIAFYKDVIGWGTQAWEGGKSPYVMWTADGLPLGGVMAPRVAGTPPHWFAHVTVDDVDASAKKAASLGGKIVVPPEDIPTIGRFSIVADPHGAVISLFKGSGPQMPEPPSTSRRFSWHQLMAGDYEAALRFYAQLFGWEKTDAVQSPMGTYQMYGKDGRTYGGMVNKPKDDPLPPHWFYYVKVDDLDATLARVKKSGGKVTHGPMPVPGGDMIAQCLDPQGAVFALHEVKPAA